MKNRWEKEREGTILERFGPIFPTKSYIVRHLDLWFILSYVSSVVWGLVSYEWYTINCLNIISWKKPTPSTTDSSWHPHQKSIIMGCGHSAVVECVLSVPKVLIQPPAPKRKENNDHGCADSLMGPHLYLVVHLYASSVLFLSILPSSKFWKSEAWVLRLCSLSIFF